MKKNKPNKKILAFLNVYMPIVSVIFLLVSIIPASADMSIDKIKQELNDAKWAYITKAENVRHNHRNWHGQNDISFKYKLKIHDGIMYVWVDVVDDKVIFKESMSIISDHIEIWVADPRLVNEHKMSLDKIRDYKEEFQERLKNPDEHNESKKTINDEIKRLKTLENQYKENRYFSQLVFNKSAIFAVPDNPYQGNINFQYNQKSTGYDFFAAIPLYGICDFKNNKIKRINYLIDVVDIDDDTATEQKTLISSSKNRIYAAPSTFNTIDLDDVYHLSLPPIEEQKIKLNPAGYLKLINGQYLYYAKKKMQFGWYWFDRYIYEGFYVRLNLGNISKLDEVQIYPYETKLLLTSKDKHLIVDLSKKYIQAAGNFKYNMLFQKMKKNKHYLVFEVNGSTYEAGGSGLCGAGEESNLIYIALNHNLKLENIKSEIFNSCRLSMELDEDDYKLKTESIMIKVTSLHDNTERRLSYDNNFPEKGLSLKTVTLKK